MVRPFVPVLLQVLVSSSEIFQTKKTRARVRLSSLDYENAYLHFLGVAFVQLQ